MKIVNCDIILCHNLLASSMTTDHIYIWSYNSSNVACY